MNKKLSFIAIILSIVTILAMLVSCGGGSTACTHADGDSDGKCDSCGETLGTPGGDADATALIKDGNVNFQFVMQSGLSNASLSELRSLAKTVGKLTSSKEEVNIAYDNVDEAIDVEILIGKVTSRGDEYIIDEHYLGPKGYSVKVIGKKILVLFGSEDAFKSAMQHLEANVFGISSGTKKLTDVAFGEDTAYEYIQDDFKLKSVTVAGQDLDDYVIVYNKSDAGAKEAATEAQKALYNKTGMWLELVTSTSYNGTTPAVIIETVENGGPQTTEAGARIFVDENKNLVIQSEFPNKTKEVAIGFLVTTVANSTKTSLAYETDFTKAVEVRKISYKDFGAKGNGRDNDFEAIRACHEYANQYGHTVAVNNGTYYIKETNATKIYVMTNVDWTGAKFIIDDSFITNKTDTADWNYHIFDIQSSYDPITYTPDDNATSGTIANLLATINAQGGINKDDFTKFEHGLGYPILVFLYDDDHFNYIRYGINANPGTEQKELIYVDADGNISADTYLLFDYAQVTRAIVYRVDDTPITIKGGDFTTIANQMPNISCYNHRGIQISRSNVTIDGVTHKITGEGEQGAPYYGFISVDYTTDVLVKNCILSAHKAYTLATNSANTMGTYDITPTCSNRTIFYNVTMFNFFLEDGVTPSIDNGYWGIMGGNDCKNLTYDTCELTRFDSHRGTYNAKIVNSTVSMVAIIGGGEFIMEDCTIYTIARKSIVILRDDYGSMWHGTMAIKNVKVITADTYKSSEFYVYSGAWNNFNHGYDVCAPETVILENIEITNPNVKTISLATGSLTSSTAVNSALYPYIYTKKVIVTDTENRYNYTIPKAYTEAKLTINGVLQ